MPSGPFQLTTMMTLDLSVQVTQIDRLAHVCWCGSGIEKWMKQELDVRLEVMMATVRMAGKVCLKLQTWQVSFVQMMGQVEEVY